jgi:hypothetical protein
VEAIVRRVMEGRKRSGEEEMFFERSKSQWLVEAKLFHLAQ